MTLGKFIRVLVLMVAAMQALGACAAGPERTAFLSKSLPFSLPKNPWTASPLSAFQQVTLRYNQSVQHFQAVVDLRPGAVKIALLDLRGVRAMDIDWTKDALKITQADWLPDEIRAEDILANIVLAYWPMPIVEKGFSAYVEFMQSGFTRHVKIGADVLISVSRDGENPWTSVTDIDYTNAPFHLTITSSLAGVEE